MTIKLRWCNAHHQALSGNFNILWDIVDVFAEYKTNVMKFKIACQCKAYTDQLVGAPELRNFLGSLLQANLNHGIYFTTSDYTAEAKEVVSAMKQKNYFIELYNYQRIKQFERSLKEI